jgi:hypothetical protein
MNLKQAEKRVNLIIQGKSEIGKRAPSLRSYQNYSVILDAYLAGYEAGKKVKKLNCRKHLWTKYDFCFKCGKRKGVDK